MGSALFIEWWLRRLHFVPHGLLITDSSEFTKRESCAIIRHMLIFGTMIESLILHEILFYGLCIDDDQSLVVTGRLFYLFQGIVFSFPGLLWTSIYCSQLFTGFLQLNLNLNQFLLPHMNFFFCKFFLLP